tara:strand:+ start:2255 stop:2425 length:171 start_codon:yes stop_codon:yes gene_type:complete
LISDDLSSPDIEDLSIPIVLTLMGTDGTPPHTIPSGDSPLKKLFAPIIQYLPILEC